MCTLSSSLSPKVIFPLRLHLTSALGAGVLVPSADVHVAALWTQPSSLAVERWGYFAYYSSNDNVLHRMAVTALHRDNPLLEQSSTFI